MVKNIKPKQIERDLEVLQKSAASILAALYFENGVQKIEIKVNGEIPFIVFLEKLVSDHIFSEIQKFKNNQPL